MFTVFRLYLLYFIDNGYLTVKIRIEYIGILDEGVRPFRALIRLFYSFNKNIRISAYRAARYHS